MNTNNQPNGPKKELFKLQGDDNNVLTYFYGGGVVKKAMAMSCHRLLSLFIFSYFRSFWSSSLKLKLTMKWWFFLMLKIGITRRRKLKKGGDLEA
jgi:hypothetical protein